MATRKSTGKSVRTLSDNSDNHDTPPVLFAKGDVLGTPGSEMHSGLQHVVQGLLTGQLWGEIKVQRDGTMEIHAADQSGNHATMTHYLGVSGYRESSMSAISGKLDPADRKVEAKRLRESGMSQVKISKRLGVSQKTISDDLKD